MSVLLDSDTSVLIIGITGRIGAYHTQRMLEYGTNLVGGVAPGKGGTVVNDLPVFNTQKEAVQATGASTAIVIVPPPFAADAIMESADAGIKLCVAITDGIPAQDMIKVKRYMMRYREANRMRLLGPNCSGVICPGQSLVGIMPAKVYQPGSIGIISRSGTLGYEAAAQLSMVGLGVSTSVGIGGDQITGSTFLDILSLFADDDGTDVVLLIGEIGGPQEADAAEFIRSGFNKPVVAYVAGSSAPEGRSLGHAGAIITAFGERADVKAGLLKEVGAVIAEDPTLLGETVLALIKSQGLSVNGAARETDF